MITDRMSFDTGRDAASAAEPSLTWIHLETLEGEDRAALQREFHLTDAVLDELVGDVVRSDVHEQDSNLLLVMRIAVWAAAGRSVRFLPVRAVLAPGLVVSVGDTATVTGARQALIEGPRLTASGSAAALPCLVGQALDGYELAVTELTDDIDEVQSTLFDDGFSRPTARIHELSRQTLDLRRAMAPLATALNQLTAESSTPARKRLRGRFKRDQGRLTHLIDEVETLSTALSNALQVDLTQISVAQNDDMRRISAWVAIWAVPTLIAGVYGMNFRHMPELGWRAAYPLVLLLMITVCGAIYRGFRRSGWL